MLLRADIERTLGKFIDGLRNAMPLSQQVLITQEDQILADGLRRDMQPLGQLACADTPLCTDGIQDLLSSFLCGHL